MTGKTLLLISAAPWPLRWTGLLPGSAPDLKTLCGSPRTAGRSLAQSVDPLSLSHPPSFPLPSWRLYTLSTKRWKEWKDWHQDPNFLSFFLCHYLLMWLCARFSNHWIPYFCHLYHGDKYNRNRLWGFNGVQHGKCLAWSERLDERSLKAVFCSSPFMLRREKGAASDLAWSAVSQSLCMTLHARG